MPLYFYHITYGAGAPAWPHEGVELADDEAAWVEATTACGEMLRDLDGALKAGPEWRMVVTRESGEVLYRLTFSAEASRSSADGDGSSVLPFNKS
jgi:hypothetical protein